MDQGASGMKLVTQRLVIDAVASDIYEMLTDPELFVEPGGIWTSGRSHPYVDLASRPDGTTVLSLVHSGLDGPAADAHAGG
jgi:hypothetical protein